MSRREAPHLRLELLRMRGEIERAETAAALAALRADAARIGAIAAVVSRVGGVLSGAAGSGWIGAVVDALGTAGGRSRWASLAHAAMRAVRRHPIAALAATVGALAFAGWWLGRRRPAAADGETG